MSIKLQKRGASWRLRYDLEPDASGVRQRRSATFTGTKAEDKLYQRHTGYPGGLRTTTAGKMRESKPERLLETAVRGMLPKNRLGRRLFTKLKVYRGAEHPHAAQRPETMAL